MELAAVCIVDTWHPDDNPQPLFPGGIPEQPHEQRMHVEAIRLRTSLAAIDFDARRVNHAGLDTMGDQEPMESEAIPTGLVAAHHPRVFRQSKALLGPVNLCQHRVLSQSEFRLPTQSGRLVRVRAADWRC
jgi:hypothetical protein